MCGSYSNNSERSYTYKVYWYIALCTMHYYSCSSADGVLLLGGIMAQTNYAYIFFTA